MHSNVDKLIYEYTKGSAVKLRTRKCYWFVHFIPWSKALKFQEIKLPFESLGHSVPRAKVKEDWGMWTEVEMYLLNTVLNLACRVAEGTD